MKGSFQNISPKITSIFLQEGQIQHETSFNDIQPLPGLFLDSWTRNGMGLELPPRFIDGSEQAIGTKKSIQELEIDSGDTIEETEEEITRKIQNGEDFQQSRSYENEELERSHIEKMMLQHPFQTYSPLSEFPNFFIPMNVQSSGSNNFSLSEVIFSSHL